MPDYQVEKLVQIDLDGQPVGLVIAKRTFVVGEDRVLRPADDPDPVLFADQLFDGDDPTKSPVRFEADTALLKRRTDVVIHGTAHAPGGQPAPSFDVTIAVGNWRRHLRVFGPRRAVWRKPAKETARAVVHTPPLFTDPTPVARVPLSFSSAYGGVAKYQVSSTGEILDIACPTNPLGKGFCVQNSPEGLDGLDLPQLEDPTALLTPETVVRELAAPEAVPVPAAFGFQGRGWYPRVRSLGVMPFEVARARAQVREQAKALDPVKDAAAIAALSEFDPPVMDPEYYQAAAAGMAVPMLLGDESVSLRGVTPSGVLAFNLPGRAPLVVVQARSGPRTVPMGLDTFVFLADELRLVLTWRGRLPLSTEGGEADDFPSLPLTVTDATLSEARAAVAERPVGSW